MANEDNVPCRFNCRIVLCGCVDSLISLFVFICVASLLVWMMLRSNAVKFQVHDAELTRFDLDLKNNNLHCNLSLSISIRNSNNHIGVHYDKFEAMVYYSDRRLASVLFMSSFYQGHKSTTVIETVFQGQNLVFLGKHGLRKFEEESKLGVYGIDVKVGIKARVLFAHLVTWPMNPTIRCHLKVPLSSSNSSGGFHFQPTRCHVDI